MPATLLSACCGAGASVDAIDKEENMLRSRAMIGGSPWPRASVVLLCALVLTGCASALAIRVPRHTDAAWKDDLSDLPAVCRKEDPPLDSPTAVVERLAEIPTRFWLASECNRQLLVAAAANVVAQNQQEIIELLEGYADGVRAGTANNPHKEATR
jgi:hypothetical protein